MAPRDPGDDWNPVRDLLLPLLIIVMVVVAALLIGGPDMFAP